MNTLCSNGIKMWMGVLEEFRDGGRGGGIGISEGCDRETVLRFISHTNISSKHSAVRTGWLWGTQGWCWDSLLRCVLRISQEKRKVLVLPITLGRRAEGPSGTTCPKDSCAGPCGSYARVTLIQP